MKFSSIKLENFKGVLLDLDNTLYDYSICHDFALKTVYNKLIKKKISEFSFVEFKKYYAKARARVNIDLENQGASHSRFLYFQKIFEQILNKTCIDLTFEFEEIYWEAFFSKMTLFEGVIVFFKNCRNKKIKICIVTDLTGRLQFEKIKILKIEKYIDFIVTSEEAGVEKPHSYIFKLALEKLKMKENEVIMIGDDLNKDITGAENLNIKAIHFKKNSEFHKEF